MNAKMIKLIGKLDMLISGDNQTTPTTTMITVKLNNGKEKSGIALNCSVNYLFESNNSNGELNLLSVSGAKDMISFADIADFELYEEDK